MQLFKDSYIHTRTFFCFLYWDHNLICIKLVWIERIEVLKPQTRLCIGVIDSIRSWMGNIGSTRPFICIRITGFKFKPIFLVFNLMHTLNKSVWFTRYTLRILINITFNYRRFRCLFKYVSSTLRHRVNVGRIF